MQLVLVQPDVAWEDRTANVDRVARLLDGARVERHALIALPEMFSVGFTMNVDGVAEGAGGPTERFLCELAMRHDAYVVGGLVRRSPSGKGRNVALVVGPEGRLIARYDKLHPFSYAGETDHYEAGADVVVFDWEGMTVAPLICYDLRFPEAYRKATAMGAEMLLTIANFPTARVHHWTNLLVARAIENQAYSVGVNRCGRDPNVDYPGRSIVVDPRGRVLVEAAGSEEVLTVSVDASVVAEYRASFPALRDMRGDLLG